MIHTLRVACYVLAVLVALATGTAAAVAAAALLVAALAVRPAVRAVSGGRPSVGPRLTRSAPAVPAQAAGATGQGSTTLSTHV